MAEICLNNKAFRESYQSIKVDRQKISVTFIKNKKDTLKENEDENFLNGSLIKDFLKNNKDICQH